MPEKLYLGSHVSMNAPDFYVGSVKSAIAFGENTFMFYTGAPQNTFRTPLEKCRIEEGRKLIKEAGIDESKIVVHAPYLINLANTVKQDIYDVSLKTLISELRRTDAFGISVMVLHPGSHVDAGADVGIRSLAKGLDEALSVDGTNVKIAIETMAGKGKEIGITFEEVRKIIDLCEHKDRLGVCLDTCHIHDAGYNIHLVDEVIEEFDRVIGLDRLLVVHVNDSKNPIGAHKDRHENLGYGEIGFETLNKWVHHPRLAGIPMILETPYIGEKPPYKEEVEMLRNKKFVEGWREKL